MNKPNIQLEKEYKLFIDGQFVEASGGSFETICPADGEALAKIGEATKEDVDRAVKSAWKAFETFKRTTKGQRAKMLFKIADIIDENKEHLAMVETLDNGKPIRETLNVDIPLAADHFRYFAGVIEAEEGTLNVIDENNLSLVIREPFGVVGQIIPWNFPFLMAAWKLAPALAAGNAVVIKPSSITSLSLLELMKLIKDVLPKGVVNVVTGKGRTTGEYMLQHEGFRKLAFTGSTEVGYNVAKAAAEKLIPATLELGGKSANIFFDDCDMDLAMDGLLLGILFNQGQVCCAGSRVFVQEGIYDEFVKKAQEKFNNVKVGMPWDMETQLGAQVNKAQTQKVLKHIENGKKEGAKVVSGGCQLLDDEFANGFFTMPTLFADVTNDMTIAKEEIFGPVASIIKFKDKEDLIKMANDSEYGLGGGVWTTNINTAINVAKELETGRVWINTYNSIPAGAPFGGYKKSGIGRETHKMALDSYSQVKNIIINTSGETSGFY